MLLGMSRNYMNGLGLGDNSITVTPAQRAFEDLMNKRYNAMRKTILTTNLTAEAFKARYCQGSGGGRLGDRLRECGEWVALTGDSLRAKP